MVNDAVDSALDSEDIEDEIEEEVDKVLTDIAGETAAQLPEAARRERTKLPAQRAEVAKEVWASTTIFPCVWSHVILMEVIVNFVSILQQEAIPEGVDEEEELEEIRARLAKVRS